MRVFISHSSHEDERARAIREAVQLRLAERGYTVLVDVEKLRPGERWRSVLYHWLAECDSAVVLLNQAALTSHWVRREVNILLWRQLLGSPVFVVPVLIDVDPPAVTASGFEELEPLQAASGEPDELVDKIMAEFAAVAPGSVRDDPMSVWIERVAHCLDKIDAGRRDELTNAARALGVGEDELGLLAAEGGSRFLAQQLLGHEGRVQHAVAGIAPWLAVEPLERLILEVEATWVDGSAARGILPRDPSRRRVVALNARQASTAEHYIARATCRALNGYSNEAAGGVALGEGGVEELVVEYENAIRRLFGLPESEPLDGWEPDWGTYYLVITPPRDRMDLAAAAIREILARFSRLVVILLTGPEPPDETRLREWRLDDAVVLRPPLEGNDERDALARTHQLRGLPRRLRLPRE